MVIAYSKRIILFLKGHASEMDFLILTINVPVVYMGRYKVVLRGDYP